VRKTRRERPFYIDAWVVLPGHMQLYLGNTMNFTSVAFRPGGKLIKQNVKSTDAIPITKPALIPTGHFQSKNFDPFQGQDFLTKNGNFSITSG
jgi:hypothetical protein